MPGHIGRLHLRTENGFQSMPRDAFTIYFAGIGIHNVAIFQ